MKSIDNDYADNIQIGVIKSTTCIKCRKRYIEGDRVVFVDTNKKLLWWHGFKQTARRKIYTCKSIFKLPNIKEVKKKEKIQDTTFEQFLNECDIKKLSTTKNR